MGRTDGRTDGYTDIHAEILAMQYAPCCAGEGREEGKKGTGHNIECTLYQRTIPSCTALSTKHSCSAVLFRGWPVGVNYLRGLPERSSFQQKSLQTAPEDILVCNAYRGATIMRYRDVNIRCHYHCHCAINSSSSSIRPTR